MWQTLVWLALVWLVLGTGLAARRASAQAAPDDALVALEVGLASDVDAERAAALARYASLGPSDVSTLVARLQTLARRPPDEDDTTRALAAFRHAVGSRRADDAVDLAPGIGPTLAAVRDPVTVRIAAAVLLERAAEQIASEEALACVPSIAGWPGDGMRLEARRIAMRLGARLAPTVIAARSHESRAVRQWADWAAARLGLDEPGRFVAGLAPDLVPGVLRAYADARVLGAVPVAASLVDAPRRATRDAARQALTTYGQNSIWVAREAYRIRAGEPADLEWGWRRTLDALFALVDAAREQVLEADLSAAERALTDGDRDAARTHLDAVLRRAPSPTTSSTGDALLRLAELDLAAGDRDEAARALRRAGRLPMSTGGAGGRDARSLLLRGDDRLRDGVLDTDGYRRAVALDSSCAECVERANQFGEEPASPSTSPPWPTWLAAATFLALALLLWPSQPSPPRTTDDEPRAPDAPADAPDATLPG